MTSTDGFIFDLGTIDIDATLASEPSFDAIAAPAYIKGDVLFQYEWSRTLNTGTDGDNDNESTAVGKSGGRQGDWANLFLFKVDASDISDGVSDDIIFHTVKANWCGHSITRAAYERYQCPAGSAGAVAGAGGASEAGARDSSVNTVTFSATSGVTNAVSGNFNSVVESEVTGFDQEHPVPSDATSHLNVAGEYMRYYSSKLFGGRLGYGLDIFSNEGELLEEVRGKDVSLNSAVLVHLETSNTAGDTDGTLKDRTNIPWLIMTQMLNDPSGRQRIDDTLSTAIQSATNYASVDASAAAATVQGIQAAAGGGNVALPSGLSDANTNWRRIPLAIGDKLRIKVCLKNDNNHNYNDSFVGNIPDRTYIIEYLLKA